MSFLYYFLVLKRKQGSLDAEAKRTKTFALLGLADFLVVVFLILLNNGLP